MLQVWSISCRISMTSSLLYQLYQAILFWIRLSLYSDWHGVWAVFIIIIFIIVIVSVVVMIIIIIIIVVVPIIIIVIILIIIIIIIIVLLLLSLLLLLLLLILLSLFGNNIPYQCDITCAGHFTLDALASRTVACVFLSLQHQSHVNKHDIYFKIACIIAVYFSLWTNDIHTYFTFMGNIFIDWLCPILWLMRVFRLHAIVDNIRKYAGQNLNMERFGRISSAISIYVIRW